MAKDDKGHGSNSKGGGEAGRSPVRYREAASGKMVSYRDQRPSEKMSPRAFKAALGEKAEGGKRSDVKPSKPINSRGDTFKPRQR